MIAKLIVRQSKPGGLWCCTDTRAPLQVTGWGTTYLTAVADWHNMMRHYEKMYGLVKPQPSGIRRV